MESWTIKIVFKYLHCADTVFQHLSLLHPPSSHLHLCLSFHVPLYLLAEITHPEQPPTLRKKSVMKLLSSLIAPFLSTIKDPWCFHWLSQVVHPTAILIAFFNPIANFPLIMMYLLLTLTALRGEEGVKITQGCCRKSNWLTFLSCVRWRHQ